MSVSSHNTLPALDSLYPLTAEQMRDFRENGHIRLSAVLSPEEILVFGPILQETALSQNRETRALADRDSYGRAFLQMINLWLLDERVQRFVFARRFARLAAKLLGVDGVRLYHDQALFKEAHGGHTPWHQDQYYWPLDTEDTLTLWMPLTPVLPEVGSMSFASGSHRSGHLGDHAIGDESETIFRKMIPEKGWPVATYGALNAGDATFHHGWTLHSAGPNPTETMRPAMTIIYFRDGAHVSALDHPARRVDRTMYLPDCNEGELAGGAFCPLLHPRTENALPTRPERDASYWKRVIDALRESQPTARA